jgi:hypothetical protein
VTGDGAFSIFREAAHSLCDAARVLLFCDAMLRFSFVLALVFLIACSSSPDDSDVCGKCNGNVAINCGLKHGCDDPTDYDYSTKTRTDCGAQTCTVESTQIECTSQGSEFSAFQSYVDCK